MDSSLSCVITDLDGTLLNCNGQPSVEDIATINKLKSKGIEVFVATGRHPFLIEKLIHEIECNMTAVCINGSLIYDFHQKKCVYAIDIPTDTAIKIREYLCREQIPHTIYTPTEIYVTKGKQSSSFYEDYYKGCNSKYWHPIYYLNDSFQIQKHQILNFLISCPQIGVLEKIQREICYDGQVQAFFSSKECIDICHIQATKGKTIRRLIRQKGIDLTQTLSIGDADNDLSMLSICGYPFTPENTIINRIPSYVSITVNHNDSPLTNAIRMAFPNLI